MEIYFQIRGTLPTKVRGGIRKIELEIMPDYISYRDVVYYGRTIIRNDHDYKENYTKEEAKKMLLEVYSKLTNIDLIRFFRYNPYTKQLDNIPANIY